MTSYRMKSVTLIGLNLAIMAISSPAAAQHAYHQRASPAATEAASTTEYRAVNSQMHGAMDVPFSGDADVEELAALKIKEKERKAAAQPNDKPAKRKKSDALREKDPW